MEKRKALPSIGTIFDHWKDKYNTITNSFVDWGEPTCPVCGKQVSCVMDHNVRKYEKFLKDSNLIAIWDSADLERHHIIPFSLDGNDSIDNLFIMCHDCHCEAPDTNDIEAFYSWLKYKRPHNPNIDINRQAIEMNNMIKSMCKNEEEYNKVIKVFNNLSEDNIYDILKNNSNKQTMHFDEYTGSTISRYGTLWLLIKEIKNLINIK